ILIRFGYSGHGRITPFWCFGTFIIPYLGGFCLILYGSILFLHVGSLRITPQTPPPAQRPELAAFTIASAGIAVIPFC
ncbi:MAG: hypothetical protein IJR93_02670, partial [Treponema sp.]|nr:hypothetical protein [Treponema sp.]